MTERKIHITEFDNKRLRDLLGEARYSSPERGRYVVK
jgi:hypothetical protein